MLILLFAVYDLVVSFVWFSVYSILFNILRFFLLANRIYQLSVSSLIFAIFPGNDDSDEKQNFIFEQEKQMLSRNVLNHSPEKLLMNDLLLFRRHKSQLRSSKHLQASKILSSKASYVSSPKLASATMFDQNCKRDPLQP